MARLDGATLTWCFSPHFLGVGIKLVVAVADQGAFLLSQLSPHGFCRVSIKSGWRRYICKAWSIWRDSTAKVLEEAMVCEYRAQNSAGEAVRLKSHFA
jgi:hypothetical protein